MPAEAKVNRKDKRIIVENVRRVLLKEYLMNETRRAGFGGLDIQRTPMGTRVTLLAERPGLVIGRKGGAIKNLTEAVEQKFRFDNPQIEVQEVASPALNAQIMAEKLANALERGWHFRRAGHSTVRRIMEAGAKGCLVVIAGKLTGQRHRTEKFKAGHIKYCGEPRNLWMDLGVDVDVDAGGGDETYCRCAGRRRSARWTRRRSRRSSRSFGTNSCMSGAWPRWVARRRTPGRSGRSGRTSLVS